MRSIPTTPPLPYRRQNDGDYLIPGMRPRRGLGDRKATGFALHLDDAGMRD
jgi:NAD(P)H dehydrogenase (quinone)